MKRNLFTIVLLFLATAGFAQNSAKIFGTITGSNNEPLQGATVRIKNQKIGTNSDSNGKYQINNLQTGEYEIEASFLGYSSQIFAKNITGDTKVDFKLEIKPITFDDIVVSSVRAASNAPFAITNITAAEMKSLKSGEELPTLLSYSPSLVSFSENGTGFGNTAFRIRGTDPSRINVTVDGVPLNDPESHTVFWVNMSDFTESVQDIQIQRGVGTSTNGASAFGASLNMKTEGYIEQASGEIINSFGSFNTMKNSVKVNSGLINNHFNFNARVSKTQSDGYVDYTGIDHKSMYLSGGYFSDKTTLRAVMFTNEEHTGISWWGLSPDSMKTNRTYNMSGYYTDKNGVAKNYDDTKDNYIQTHYHLHWLQKFNQNLQLNSSLFFVKGDGYYEEIHDNDNWLHSTNFEEYGFQPTIYAFKTSTDSVNASDLIRRKWLDNSFYGGNLSLNYKKDKIDISLGGGLNRYDGDHFGRIMWMEFNPGIAPNHEYYRSNSIKDDVNTYIKANYQISDKLSAYADVQYRGIAYTMKGLTSKVSPLDITQNYNFLNPKAGLFYNVKNHSAYASAAISHREPTRADLVDAINAAKSKPTPETLYDIEMGYNFRNANLAFGANLYYMYYIDQLAPTGEKNDVGSDILSNVPESYRTGIEFSGKYKILRNLSIDGNVTLSQNKIINFVEFNNYYDADWNQIDYKGVAKGNTNLAFSPEIISAFKVNYSPIKNLNISVANRYIGDQYFDNTSENAAKIPAYYVADFIVDYSISLPMVKEAGIKFKLNNVLDTDYFSNAYGGKDIVGEADARWTYYYPQAFRNYMVQLNFKF